LYQISFFFRLHRFRDEKDKKRSFPRRKRKKTIVSATKEKKDDRSRDEKEKKSCMNQLRRRLKYTFQHETTAGANQSMRPCIIVHNPWERTEIFAFREMWLLVKDTERVATHKRKRTLHDRVLDSLKRMTSREETFITTCKRAILTSNDFFTRKKLHEQVE
jgi:hypothetical protein